MVFSSSSRNESRSRSCSAERITVDATAAAMGWLVHVGGIIVDGDHTLPDSIFSSVGTIRLIGIIGKICMKLPGKTERIQIESTNQIWIDDRKSLTLGHHRPVLDPMEVLDSRLSVNLDL